MSIAKANAPVPVLTPLDEGYSRIVFQFVPSGEGLTEAVGSTFSEAYSLGRINPILQFTKGVAAVFSFEARLYGEKETDDVLSIVQQLKAATISDPVLSRPPLWSFSYGAVIQEQVVIESLGGIRYGTLRNDGMPRSVTLSISLRRYEPYSLQLTDPNARPHDTYYTFVRDGDTWEHLAKRQYRDASLGDLVRRLNPSLVLPPAGTAVALPDKDNIQYVPITPDNHVLARTNLAIAARRDLFKARGATRVSTVLTKV